MQLPQEAIDEFEAIWKQEFGEELSNDVARIEAVSLIELMKTLLESKCKETQ